MPVLKTPKALQVPQAQEEASGAEQSPFRAAYAQVLERLPGFPKHLTVGQATADLVPPKIGSKIFDRLRQEGHVRRAKVKGHYINLCRPARPQLSKG